MLKKTSTLTQCIALITVCQQIALCQSGVTGSSSTLVFQQAFGVARNTSNSSSSGVLSFPLEVSNVHAWYDLSSDSFVARSHGLYFLYICVGVTPQSTVKVQQVGGFPKISYTWQSTNDGIKLGCRGGISILSTNSRVRLDFQGAGIYSDNLQQTSFSAFSISEAMTSAQYSLFVSYSQGPRITAEPIPFGQQGIIFVNPAAPTFNAATSSYTCPYDGPYFVSVSVGIRSGQFAQVLLTADNDPINFELTRTSHATNGLTTLSRSVLVSCTTGTSLQVQLVNGEITSGDSAADNLASFTVIPYAPVRQSSAWALYRTSSWSATVSSGLTFDQIEVLDAVTYHANNGTLKISLNGTYMVYLSAATVPNQPMNLVVRRNSVVIMGLVTSPTESDGTDTVEHGVIVELEAGDVLDVVGDGGSSAYSDDGQQVGFFGFLVYEQWV